MSRSPARRLLFGGSAGSIALLSAPTTPTVATSLVETLVALPVTAAGNAAVANLCGVLQGLEAGAPPPARGTTGLSVTLDDGLTRSFVVTPPSGAHGLRELQACAAARFAALYGESAEQWRLAADWQVTVPFVACALPRELFGALEELAGRQRWRLDSVCPALIRVWNHVQRSIPANGWLLVGYGQTLTVVHSCNDQVADVRTLHLPGAPDVAELEMLLEQEQLRTPVPGDGRPPQALLWAGGADWLPAAATIAGLASRVIRVPVEAAAGDRSAAWQLALAGACG